MIGAFEVAAVIVALAAMTGASVGVLEQSGDNMLMAHRQNQQIPGRRLKLEADIDAIFQLYLAEVSRDIAVAIEQRDMERLSRDLNLFWNTMFELWVENFVERAAISSEIWQFLGEQGDVIGRLTKTRTRAEVGGDDEIGRPAQAFNGMADQIETRSQQEQQLIRQIESKNAELERFVYNLSHQRKSPLVITSDFIGHPQKDFADGNEKRDELTELGGDVPAALADEARIGKAIRNLIENGIKLLPVERQPYPRISAEAKDGHLLCRVQDNGIGIEQRFHGKVFDLFDRLDNSVPGSGIGLAMVRRIIETHDGKIWIDSKPDGQGSCFCFTLPLAQGG